MQEFHFDITHLKGVNNPADYISRYIHNPSESNFVCPQQYTSESFDKPKFKDLHYISNTNDSNFCIESDDTLSSTNDSSKNNIPPFESNVLTRSKKQQSQSQPIQLQKKRGRPKKNLHPSSSSSHNNTGSQLSHGTFFKN
uniref:Uncharacterized protein n=1 Tax=Strongyloides stercoralis TaxID=6248 RepID=A0A0K0ETN8_STRER